MSLPPVKDDPSSWRECTKCGEEFIDIKTHWKNRAKTKKTGTCRECSNKASRIAYKKNAKKYYKKHREWCANNPGYMRDYFKNYKYEENLE